LPFEQESGQETHGDAALNPEILLLEEPGLDARFLPETKFQEPDQFTNPDRRTPQKIRRYEHITQKQKRNFAIHLRSGGT